VSFCSKSAYATLLIMKRGVTIFWIGLFVLIVLGIGASFFAKAGPNKLDSFAQCIKDSGVIFYGAFWCPHCQNTKKMFGTAQKYLPYIECSTPDGQGQLQICKDKGVTNYPWWTHPATSTVLTGEHTLQELADFSSCTLPK